MSDIHTILKSLEAHNPDAARLAERFIQNYPGAHVRWRKMAFRSFKEQIDHMAEYVQEFSQDYMRLRNEVATRIINVFRTKDGQLPMFDTLKDKTPPKDTRMDTYKGPHAWAKFMLQAEELGWHDQAENAYLTAVNDKTTNGSLKERIKHILSREFNLQVLCTAISSHLRESRVTQSLWLPLSPVLRAYVLRSIINHFVPELTQGKIDVPTLLQWAIKEDPKLQGFVPMGIDKSLYEKLRSPVINLTKPPIPMSDLSHYNDTPIARPTIVYGEDVDLMEEDELIAAAESIQGRIDKLRKIPGNSKNVARKIKLAEEAMKVVIDKLDEDLEEQ